MFPVTASAANTHASVPAFRRISRETHHYCSALPDDGCVYMYRDGKEWTERWLVAPDGTQLEWERLNYVRGTQSRVQMPAAMSTMVQGRIRCGGDLAPSRRSRPSASDTATTHATAPSMPKVLSLGHVHRDAWGVRLTRAAHMQGEPVRATVRFSNGGGDPNVPDFAPDVRGLAVTFHLADGSRTDISAQTVPRFPVRDVDAFIEIVRLSRPGRAGAFKLLLFVARHPRVLGALRMNRAALQPPPSFAARGYYAFHAFKWLDPEGHERFVRYTWKPTIAVAALGPGEAKAADVITCARSWSRASRPDRSASSWKCRSPAPVTIRTIPRRYGRSSGSGSSSARWR